MNALLLLLAVSCLMSVSGGLSLFGSTCSFKQAEECSQDPVFKADMSDCAEKGLFGEKLVECVEEKIKPNTKTAYTECLAKPTGQAVKDLFFTCVDRKLKEQLEDILSKCAKKIASESNLPAAPSLAAGWKAWSMWSECSQSCGGGLKMRVRQCEDGQFCEENSFEVEKIVCNAWMCLDGVWGEWSSCEDGVRSREVRCDEEWDEEWDEDCYDIDECEEGIEGDGEWSEWGECRIGEQERSRCTWKFGCETELQSCGGGVNEVWNWTKWSKCSEGFRSRQKCSPQGDGCDYEDVECEGSEESTWTEWGACQFGFQEREKCQDSICLLDSRMCKGREEGGTETVAVCVVEDEVATALKFKIFPDCIKEKLVDSYKAECKIDAADALKTANLCNSCTCFSLFLAGQPVRPAECF